VVDSSNRWLCWGSGITNRKSQTWCNHSFVGGLFYYCDVCNISFLLQVLRNCTYIYECMVCGTNYSQYFGNSSGIYGIPRYGIHNAMGWNWFKYHCRISYHIRIMQRGRGSIPLLMHNIGPKSDK
jgi:hypothetical protein